MNTLIFACLLITLNHFILSDSKNDFIGVGHNQQNAHTIYKFYIDELTEKEALHLPNAPQLLKSFAKGSYDGMKEGVKDAVKISSATFLTTTLLKGAQYCLPHFLAPIKIETPEGYVPQTVDPKTPLFMSGLLFFLKLWVAKNMVPHNPMAFKTMSQEDVFKPIYFAKIERHKEPIIHDATDILIETIKNKLIEGQENHKKYDELAQLSGVRIFYGPSGTGKTDGVKSAALKLYQSLPESIRDEVLFVECCLKQANTAYKTESAKNVEKLDKYFVNIINTPNKGKKVRALILISNEVKLGDRETTLKNDEEAKSIIEAHLNLFDKIPTHSIDNKAFIGLWITSNDSLENFDKAVRTRLSESQHFYKLSPEKYHRILTNVNDKSIKTRNMQLIDERRLGLFTLFSNLRALPYVEVALWQSWGQGNRDSVYSPLFYPIQFNHRFSSRIIQDYCDPQDRLNLVQNINKLDQQKLDMSFLLNHENKQPLNYGEIEERSRTREDRITEFKKSHIKLYKATSHPAYQAAVLTYQKELKQRHEELKKRYETTQRPTKKINQSDADFKKELGEWEFSFEHFVKNEYSPVLPKYNLIKRNALKLRHFLLGKEEFNLQDLRDGIVKHQNTIVDLHIERNNKLIQSYKVDYQSMQYMKINDSNNKILPSARLVQLTEQLKDAAAARMFDPKTRTQQLTKLNQPYKFANTPQLIERKFFENPQLD